MRFEDSLNRLFASGGHLAVLRALWKNRGQGLTGREVAKAAKLSSAQTARILRALQDEGIALSQSAGPSFVWRWNESHLWAPRLVVLFNVEVAVRNELVSDLRVAFRGLPVKDARLFGSIARGDERVDSDIDLFVETRDFRAAQKVREALNERSPRFWAKYGNPVSPLILTTQELRNSPNRKRIETIREKGIGIGPGP